MNIANVHSASQIGISIIRRLTYSVRLNLIQLERITRLSSSQLEGPEDVLIYNTSSGLYHQSVTLTARMWPPIEAGPPSTVWGLPAIVWGILIGCLVIVLLVLATLFFCCWLLPRKRKFLSPTRYCTTSPVAHRSSIVAKQWTESGHMVVPMTIGMVPPQYSAPPAPPPHPRPPPTNQRNTEYPPSPACGTSSMSPSDSKCNIPETHKSMWAINPLYASNTVLSENDAAYKSRSLPSWGKSKPRPVSTADDLEELYAKVNFSKKRRNRMRNDEAAIIALCRSRSQNLAGLPLEREGVVIYDERTAL
ncbi:unnamed protein product [Hermetia illucens]|uniref:Uncharacterized protein n=1 Tax=Hermetia illucens TaxID=343691 RepID=A0A7R8YXK3_HERIL|nr:unnamed protein product [Hermetia illucens]